jgi:hypothetical protein
MTDITTLIAWLIVAAVVLAICLCPSMAVLALAR